MSGSETFFRATSFNPVALGGEISTPNANVIYTVSDPAAPLNVGEAGPELFELATTFLGTIANGLAFAAPYNGADIIYILTPSSVPTYGDTINNIAGVTIFPVPYNFDSIFCFLEGAQIATPNAEVPVETLKIGDMVTTADGRAVRVKWVGVQSVANSVLNADTRAPVIVTKGALGESAPHTDLYVSGDHGLIIDGLVINAGALVNNSTIRYVPMADLPPVFTYYHVETEDHDVILANGVPAETFIDYAGRTRFNNYQEYVDLYGTERIIPEMDRPRISSRRQVPEAIKARLDTSPDWETALDDPTMRVTLDRGAA